MIATLYLTTSKYQSKMHLVDLAGSERLSVKLQSVQGQETKHINASLAALNKVISALSARQSFIPYRESQLTRLLSDSLGGGCKTLLITCISPAAKNYYETLNSLRFAERAKKIVVKAQVNEIQTPGENTTI